MTKRKNLDLSFECIKEVTKEAIDKDTVFKLHAESILEEYANNIKNSIKLNDKTMEEVYRSAMNDNKFIEDLSNSAYGSKFINLISLTDTTSKLAIAYIYSGYLIGKES